MGVEMGEKESGGSDNVWDGVTVIKRALSYLYFAESVCRDNVATDTVNNRYNTEKWYTISTINS